MLPGIISDVKRFDINSILNINNRVSTFYGNNITETIELNKLAIESNKIENVSFFEDSIGNIPVVNQNQKIGLILDKASKLVRGTELISGTNLSAFTVRGTGSKTNNSITTTAINSGVTRNILVPGTWYEIVIDYTSTTTDVFSINTLDTTTSTIREIRVENGKAIFLAEYTNLFLKHGSNGVSSGVSISLKTLPGHHLYQNDPLLKPVLSYRVNRVNASNDLTDPLWANTNVVVTEEILAPDGTLTAFSLKNTVSSNSKLTQSIDYFTDQPGQYLRTVCVKPGAEVGATIIFEGVGGTTLDFYVGFNTKTKLFTLSTSLLDDYGFEELEDGWLLVWMKITQSDINVISNNIFIGSQTNTSTQHEVLVWHPDNRLMLHSKSNIPKYQNTYGDGAVDTAGFNAYLDIVNGAFLTTNLNLVSANRVAVLTTFAVMNNVTNSIYLEYGSNSDTDDGTFGIKIPAAVNANAVMFSARGTVKKNTTYYFEGKAPKYFSLMGYIDLLKPELSMSINKVNKPIMSSSLGVSTFSNKPLFLFKRNGDSLAGNYHVLTLPIIIFMNSLDSGFTKTNFRELKKSFFNFEIL